MKLTIINLRIQLDNGPTALQQEGKHLNGQCAIIQCESATLESSDGFTEEEQAILRGIASWGALVAKDHITSQPSEATATP